jgi:hypothetical protein
VECRFTAAPVSSNADVAERSLRGDERSRRPDERLPVSARKGAKAGFLAC